MTALGGVRAILVARELVEKPLVVLVQLRAVQLAQQRLKKCSQERRSSSLQAFERIWEVLLLSLQDKAA